MPSIGGNVSSLRDVLPLPPGIANPSYAGRGERTADIMRPGGFDQREAPASTAAARPNTVFHERGRELRGVLPIILVGTGGGLRNDLPA